MPYWNFEYIYTVVKVGGGIGQDPATEVTHLRLNQPPVFSSEYVIYVTSTVGPCPVFMAGTECMIRRLHSMTMHRRHDDVTSEHRIT